jgi:hypothetical protein
MKTMRKCNDEIYQLAKDQALVKKLKKNKRFKTTGPIATKLWWNGPWMAPFQKCVW